MWPSKWHSKTVKMTYFWRVFGRIFEWYFGHFNRFAEYWGWEMPQKPVSILTCKNDTKCHVFGWNLICFCVTLNDFDRYVEYVVTGCLKNRHRFDMSKWHKKHENDTNWSNFDIFLNDILTSFIGLSSMSPQDVSKFDLNFDMPKMSKTHKNVTCTHKNLRCFWVTLNDFDRYVEYVATGCLKIWSQNDTKMSRAGHKCAQKHDILTGFWTTFGPFS